MAAWYVATSGWRHPTWKGTFYSRGLTRGREETPADFRFAVKAWRRLTHHRRLDVTDDGLAAFSTCLDLLGEKAPVVLVQLPPRFPADPDLLDGFLRRWPDGRRLAFEFRDPAWHTDAVFRVLRTHNAAFVPFELGDERAPAVATADFVYVRLHGREAKYRGRYDEAALGAWADWLRGHVAEGRDA